MDGKGGGWNQAEAWRAQNSFQPQPSQGILEKLLQAFSRKRDVPRRK